MARNKTILLIALVVLLIAFMLAACFSPDPNRRMIQIESAGNYSVWIDQYTRVMYISWGGWGGHLQPLVDRDGNPLIMEEWE